MPPYCCPEATTDNVFAETTAGGQKLVILTASVGGGHDGPAREIARRLENAGHDTKVIDLVTLLPGGSGPVLRSLVKLQLKYAPKSWGRGFNAWTGAYDHHSW